MTGGRTVLILQHDASSPPGFFAEYLARNQFSSLALRVREAADVPATALLDEVCGVAVFGNEASTLDAPAWLPATLQLLRQAFHNSVPIFGHDLGGQLLALAAGGEVARNPAPEISWFPVTLHPAAAHAPWLQRLGTAPGEVFLWHEGGFTAPPGALPLLSTPLSCQAFALDTAIGVQFHPELTAPMYQRWLPIIGARSPTPGVHLQSHDELADSYRSKISAQRALARTFYDHWMTLLLRA